jgi:hypothetical protein
MGSLIQKRTIYLCDPGSSGLPDRTRAGGHLLVVLIPKRKEVNIMAKPRTFKVSYASGKVYGLESDTIELRSLADLIHWCANTKSPNGVIIRQPRNHNDPWRLMVYDDHIE